MDLRAKPFYLNDEQIAWVESTLAGMSTNDKVGQLFHLMLVGPKEAIAARLESYDKMGFKPGGYLLRGAPSSEIREKISLIQSRCEIPALISGDLDRGASNMITDGTSCGHQMEIAATGEPELAYKTGLICAQECAAVGAHWNFGPVVDIDLNHFSPITNVRTFGSDADTVLEFASNIARGMRDGGLIPCVKHWPGDGVDFRDQHFHATINDLSVEEWDATFGKVYKGMIDDGVESLMTAHIMLPAYSRLYDPSLTDEQILPASLEKNLHNKLLREKLGFNGLIITDATSMAGFTECMPRSVAVPLCIENGADVFLFTRDTEEDFEYMKKGVEDGILSTQRLDEAVTRILALKAKVNLHTKKADGTLVPPVEALEIFGKNEGEALAREIADKGITLVKDTQSLLPLDPAKQKNIYVIAVGDTGGYHNGRGGYANIFVEKMRAKGFNVMVYDNANPADPIDYGRSKIEELKKQIDVVVYFANVQTNGSDAAARITWPGLRATLPLLINEIPMMMVSIDNPYLLLDAPRIPTYINAYTSEELVVDEVVNKIVGESPFKGRNPVDPFVGIFNTKL